MRLAKFFVSFALTIWVAISACQPISGPIPPDFNFTLDSASINVTQRYQNLMITYTRNNQLDSVPEITFMTRETQMRKSVNIVQAYRVLEIATSYNVARFEVKTPNRSLGIITLTLEADKTRFYGYKIREVMFNNTVLRPRTDLSEYSFDFPIN